MSTVLDSPALARELAALVGAAHVIAPVPAASPYNLDATGPWRGLRGRADGVVLPGDAGEVAAVLAWCYRHDVPLIARGGGTGVAGGAAPLDGGLVCSLERLRRVRALEPALWRVHVEAGVSTRHVQRLARENGLFFPPDPGAAEQSQIGGNVATNAGGPHAFKYGPTGDWVTGLEAAVAPGELVEVGGVYRKDVAGYDLKRLLIGSEGTLGVITAVRLRLLPAPAAALGLVAFLGGRDEGCAAILDALGSGARPAALDFLDARTLEILAPSFPGDVPGGARFALLAELDGEPAQAHGEREDLAAALEERALALQRHDDVGALWRWRDGVSGAVSAVRGGKVSEDVVVPVEHLAFALERHEQIAAAHGLTSCAWGHGGDGNVHATVMVDPADARQLAAAGQVCDELFALVGEAGGSISGEHGVGWLKRGQLARQWSEPALRMHQQLKTVFDPKGLLNPGKKLARAL